MKVALLTDSDVFAGTERHILDLATGLSSEKVEAMVACPVEGELAKRARAMKLKVLPVEKGGRFDWKAVLALRDLLKTGQVDLIHAHNGRSALLTAIAHLLARKGKWLYTQHFIQTSRERQKGLPRLLKQAVHRWISSRACGVIAISNVVRDGVLLRRDVAVNKTVVVHNGIPDPKLGALASVADVRERLGLPPTTPLIVCVARLEAEKNIETLLEALALLRQTHFHCLVIGDGSQRELLENSTQSLNLGSKVRFLGFCEDAHSYVQTADLFVLPSAAEPFGLALVEAMALGKPVIAAAQGGPVEIVEHGHSGLLFTPGQAGTLADAITQFLNTPSLQSAMGDHARTRYLEKFTLSQMAFATANAYRIFQ